MNRISVLNEIQFEWNVPKAAWTRHLEDLKAFKRCYGHCNVSSDNLNYPNLGKWVKEQRRFYFLEKDGVRTSLTQARIDELNKLGFCWSMQEAIWAQRYQEFLEFKTKHGHAFVPSRNPDNPNLGSWVRYQRREYHRLINGGKGYITDERVRLLNDAGFKWASKKEMGIKRSPKRMTKSSMSVECANKRDESILSEDRSYQNKSREAKRRRTQ